MPDAAPTFRRQATRPARRPDYVTNYQRYNRQHAKWRELVLELDPVCHWPIGDRQVVAQLDETTVVTCQQRCMEPATVADHIKPLADFPELALDLDNGQGLCTTHHAAKTVEERRGIYRNTREGR